MGEVGLNGEGASTSLGTIGPNVPETLNHGLRPPFKTLGRKPLGSETLQTTALSFHFLIVDSSKDENPLPEPRIASPSKVYLKRRGRGLVDSWPVKVVLPSKVYLKRRGRGLVSVPDV